MDRGRRDRHKFFLRKVSEPGLEHSLEERAVELPQEVAEAVANASDEMEEQATPFDT